MLIELILRRDSNIFIINRDSFFDTCIVGTPETLSLSVQFTNKTFLKR